MNAPCKNCENRYLGCHDNCDSYKKFKKYIRLIKIKERERDIQRNYECEISTELRRRYKK